MKRNRRETWWMFDQVMPIIRCIFWMGHQVVAFMWIFCMFPF